MHPPIAAPRPLRKHQHRVAPIHCLARMRKAPPEPPRPRQRKHIEQRRQQPVRSRRQHIQHPVPLLPRPPVVHQHLPRHRARHPPPHPPRQRIQHQRPIERRHMIADDKKGLVTLEFVILSSAQNLRICSFPSYKTISSLRICAFPSYTHHPRPRQHPNQRTHHRLDPRHPHPPHPPPPRPPRIHHLLPRLCRRPRQRLTFQSR